MNSIKHNSRCGITHATSPEMIYGTISGGMSNEQLDNIEHDKEKSTKER